MLIMLANDVASVVKRGESSAVSCCCHSKWPAM